MNNYFRIFLTALLFSVAQTINAQSFGDSTVFRFGGYVKADFIHTWYMNGDVGRLQISANYWFGYKNIDAYEKN